MSELMIIRVQTRSSKLKPFRAFDEAAARISQTEVRTITVGKHSWMRAIRFGSIKILVVNGLMQYLDGLFFRLTRNRPGLLKVNPNLYEEQSPPPVHNIEVYTFDQAIDEIKSLEKAHATNAQGPVLLLLSFEKDLASSLSAFFPNYYVVHFESNTPLETEPFDFIYHVVGEVHTITCQMTFYFGNVAIFRQNYNYPTRRTAAATSLSYAVDSASLLLKRYRHLQGEIPERIAGEVFSPRIPRTSKMMSIWRLFQKFFTLTVQARLSSIPRLRPILPPRKVWSVSLARTTAEDDSSYNFVQIPNPETSWLADPFLVERGSETFLFVEEFDLAQGRGEISVAEIISGSPIKPSVCLAETFHLSFPFIFRYSNTFYMCPETHNAKEIRIYKSEEFPLHWKLAAKHLSGDDCSDTIIFEFNGHWWLITTKESVSGGDFYSELFVYFADNPVDGPWNEHAQNPVVVDSGRGRNGGFHICDGRLFRFGQEFGDFEYGVGLHSYEISTLTKSEYLEERAECKHFAGLPIQLSGHHMDISSKYIVRDSKR